MKKIIVTLGLVVISLFANEHEAVSHATISDSDFIPRVVNFVIFVGILWSLLADKIKIFYVERSEKIASAFQEVENKLKESKQHKENLKNQVEETHKKAEDIIKSAQKEVDLIKNQILATATNEIELLNKQFEEYKKYEEARLKQEVVSSYLDNLVKDIHLSSDEVANIVTKRIV
jgi:F-type H+-transporting ATPase subunit b